MLTIRKEQMDVLNAHMREQFIRSGVAHLKEVFPEKVGQKTEDELRAVVDDGTNRAASYAITGERQVVLFIDLVVGVGEDFEQRPGNEWMLSILRNPELDQHEKMDLIYARLQAREASP